MGAHTTEAECMDFKSIQLHKIMNSPEFELGAHLDLDLGLAINSNIYKFSLLMSFWGKSFDPL